MHSNAHMANKVVSDFYYHCWNIRLLGRDAIFSRTSIQAMIIFIIKLTLLPLAPFAALMAYGDQGPDGEGVSKVTYWKCLKDTLQQWWEN